jgi:hypothetical protein
LAARGEKCPRHPSGCGAPFGQDAPLLIAGNEAPNRLPRREEFWGRMADKAFWNASAAWAPAGQPLSYWKALSYGVPGFFKPNPLAFPGPHMPLGADHAARTAALTGRTRSVLIRSPLSSDKARLKSGWKGKKKGADGHRPDAPPKSGSQATPRWREIPPIHAKFTK